LPKIPIKKLKHSFALLRGQPYNNKKGVFTAFYFWIFLFFEILFLKNFMPISLFLPFNLIRLNG